MLMIRVAHRLGRVNDSSSPAPGEQLPPALSDQVGYLLGQAHLAHRRLVDEPLARLGLAVKEFSALSVLTDEGPLSQQRLGERMRVDRSTMVAVIDALEQHGFVARTRNPDDRRAYALATTARGRRVLVRAVVVVREAEKTFLASLPERERDRFTTLLRTLVTT